MLRDRLGRLTLPSTSDENYTIADEDTSPSVAIPQVPREPAYLADKYAIAAPACYYAEPKPKSDISTLVLTKSLQWFYIAGTLLVTAILVLRIVWEVLFMRFQ